MTKQVTDTERHVTHMWSGDGSGHYSEQEPLCMRLLQDMLPEFSGGSVLEVGPGTGLFAKMMFDCFKVDSYTVLDLEENIGDSRRLLEGEGLVADYVFSQDYERLFGKPFDLLVSNVCLPETPAYYQAAIGKEILPYCGMAFIVGGDGSSGGVYNEMIEAVFNSVYSSWEARETGYCGTLALAGSQLKGLT